MTRLLATGTTCHYDDDGRIHRDGGPACHHPDGSWMWYRHGRIHREDGPAVRLVFGDGRIEEQDWVSGVQLGAERVIQ